MIISLIRKKCTIFFCEAGPKKRFIMPKEHLQSCLHRGNQKYNGLYQYSEKISDTYKKRWLKFCGEMLRMDINRLINRILTSSLKVKNNWLTEIQRDLQEIGITETTMQNRFAICLQTNSQLDPTKPGMEEQCQWEEEEISGVREEESKIIS